MTIIVEYDEVMGSFVAVCANDRVILLGAQTWAEADAEADVLEAEQEMLYDEF
jgi:hypothetical protein